MGRRAARLATELKAAPKGAVAIRYADLTGGAQLTYAARDESARAAGLSRGVYLTRLIDGLQDPVLADVFSELVEVGVRKFGARVARVLVQQRYRDKEWLAGCHGLEEVSLAQR